MGFELQSIQSFHVGGQLRQLQGRPVEHRVLAQGGQPRPVDVNGDHMVGQMYAQWYRLASPRLPWPVLLWHGGGMTGANWETTPDDRTGWLQLLLESGLDACVSDSAERGRSGWALWPELYETPALMRSMQEGWDMFRIGLPAGYASDPSARLPHAGQRFPVGSFDQFACQWVPRWTGHEDMIMRAYGALLERTGPCLLVGHSQGGGFALRAAAQWPHLVRAVVALEPSGAPALQAPEAHAAHPPPPHLVVWGDHIGLHPQWQRYQATVQAYCAALAARGVPVTQCDLASHGMPGHSHFPMLDQGSDQVFRLVRDWLLEQAPRTSVPPS